MQTVHHYGNHATLGERMPVVHLSDRPYWIRTIHSFSDAGRRAATEHELSIGDAMETLRPCFRTIDLDRALAALAG